VLVPKHSGTTKYTVFVEKFTVGASEFGLDSLHQESKVKKEGLA
jgi:hypothetical protein